MATVFSVEAVAAGQIPTEGAQARAAQLVVERIGGLAASYGTEANVLIYGSVGSGRTPDIRNDVDGIAVVDDFLRDDNAVTTGHILGVIAAEMHVPLDVRVMTPAEIRASEGTLAGDPLFVEHLQYAQATSPYRRGNATNGLLSITDIRPTDDQLPVAVGTTRDYLVHKTDKMMAAQRSQGLDVHAMQRGLELPRSVGRKIGRVLQLAGYIDGDVTDLLAPADAERVLQSLAAEDKRWRAAEVLGKLNAAYDATLHHAIDRRIGIDGYRDWLMANRGKVIEQSLLLIAAARTLLIREFI